MKKIVLILAVICLTVTASQAQLRLGAKAGVNITGISGSDMKELIDNNVTGFYIGPSMQLMFGGKLGMDLSLLYAQEGITPKTSETQRMGYLQVPVNIKYVMPLGSGGVSLYGGLGPYLSFKVNGDDSFNANVDGVSQQWEAESFGAGLNFNVGFAFARMMQVGVNYSLGLSDNYKVEGLGYSGKERVWSLYAAIYF